MRNSASPAIDTATPGAAAALDPGWARALAAAAFVVLWTLGWYWSTVAGMVDIWERSETFAHGFLVPPIACWLAWRERARLVAVPPRPNYWVLVLLAGAGFVWLLAQLVAVNALAQAALVALLVLAFPAIFGLRAARAIAFPLGFLFFAVPVGEFMMPKMMEWTADVTVAALRISGIPVFREGQQFSIPSGNWSVVEACSGIRYLIASLTVGTLYAWLSYRSLGRRLAFVGVSIVVPIVANWVRAYMIVMLGHLSGNRIAAGADHLVYGWAFFGVVILLMFMMGARWREDTPLADSATARTTPRGTDAPGNAAAFRFWPAVLGVAVVTVAWPLIHRAIERADTTSIARMSPLPDFGHRSATAGVSSDWTPRFRLPSAEVHASYEHEGRKVGLYIAYYRNQNYERKLVSSENVLVASNDPSWARVASGVHAIGGGRPVDVRTAELRRTDGQRLVVWQWYWVAGRLTANDYVAKAWNALSRLAGRGDDAAAIVVYTPKGGTGTAEAALDAFVRDAMPAVDAALRETWGRR